MVPTLDTRAIRSRGPQSVRPEAGDLLFRGLVICIMCLEIVVFIEPAPVDVVLVACLVLGICLGKLGFAAVETAPLVSLAVFALANLVSMYDPFDPARAVWYVFVTLYLVASWFFFVGLIGRYGEPMIATLINAYCFAGLISALLGAGGYLGLLPFRDTLLLNGRARGLFKDCNVYGPYFVPMALFALTRLMDTSVSKRAKAVPAVLFFFAVLAILLAFSRACWLNFAVSLAVLFLTQQMFMNSGIVARRRLRMGALVVLGGALTVIVLVHTAPVKEMLALRVTSNGLQDYDRVRFATQSLSLETAERRPLGIGPGQAELVFGYATHSMYLRILSENGLVALAALLIFIGSTAARALAYVRHGRNDWLRDINLVVLACIVGHLVNSAVIDTVHWRHIWFIYALPWMPLSLREQPWRPHWSRVMPAKRAPLFAGPRLIGG